MASKIQLRRDTLSNWISNNPILSDGEQGYETDTGKIKIGNGVDDWNTLEYNFESTSGLTIEIGDENYINEGNINYYFGGSNTLPNAGDQKYTGLVIGDNNLTDCTYSGYDIILGHDNLKTGIEESEENLFIGNYNLKDLTIDPLNYYVYQNFNIGTVKNFHDSFPLNLSDDFYYNFNIGYVDLVTYTADQARARDINLHHNINLGHYVFKGENNYNNVILTPTPNSSFFSPSANDYSRTNCTAIGNNTLQEQMILDNSTSIGRNRVLTGSNQVQLGDSNTTTYAYGRVQDRSDRRDKKEIEELDKDLALNFINKVKPSTYKFDYREDYYEIIEKEIIDEKTGKKTIIKEKVEIENDGSKVRNRRHRGVIAQEIKEVMDDLGFDFAGFQDHSLNGGKDVLSIGYQEFIPYLISSVQTLTELNKQLIDRVEVLEDINNIN